VKLCFSVTELVMDSQCIIFNRNISSSLTIKIMLNYGRYES